MLNKQSFTKENLSGDDYIIEIGRSNLETKEKIIKDVKEKFGIEIEKNLSPNFKETNGYTIYTLLVKNFEFKVPFTKLDDDFFGNQEDKVEYFGINANSSEELNQNVDVLFCNSKNDFAVKLKTKEKSKNGVVDEAYLYRTDENMSFEESYNQMKEKEENYKGEKTFLESDELKIPYINIDTLINYRRIMW